MDQREIIKQAENIVPILSECINVNYLVLFGSQIKGTQHKWSDIDIAIVSDNLPKGIMNDDIALALVKVHEINDRFEPHFFRLEKWNHPPYGSFVETIKKTGRVIYPNGF